MPRPKPRRQRGRWVWYCLMFVCSTPSASFRRYIGFIRLHTLGLNDTRVTDCMAMHIESEHLTLQCADLNRLAVIERLIIESNASYGIHLLGAPSMNHCQLHTVSQLDCRLHS
jgi:hypothetical protein